MRMRWNDIVLVLAIIVLVAGLVFLVVDVMDSSSGQEKKEAPRMLYSVEDIQHDKAKGTTTVTFTVYNRGYGDATVGACDFTYTIFVPRAGEVGTKKVLSPQEIGTFMVADGYSKTVSLTFGTADAGTFKALSMKYAYKEF